MRYCAIVLLLILSTPAGARSLGGWSSVEPHPAVVRVVVPEADGTAYGSGTLIDVRDDYGLVLTNWHVVCAAKGPIEVSFPSGFVSQARALKMDSDWDLAALVVWRPPCQPVRLAQRPPCPGDALTICGYGSGNYRAVTGRCTQFYAPRIDLPQELVELDVQARQGDSGGPIFNDRGELAGVLFGAGQGTTLGSFEGRVKSFLASLAPDIGRDDSAPQVALKSSEEPRSLASQGPRCRPGTHCENGTCASVSEVGAVCVACDAVAGYHPSSSSKVQDQSRPKNDWPKIETDIPGLGWSSAGPAASRELAAKTETPHLSVSASEPTPKLSIVSGGLFEDIKNGLAVIGVLALLMQVVRLAG